MFRIYTGRGEAEFATLIDQILPIIDNASPLCRIMARNKSDKALGRHNYGPLYHTLLTGMRESATAVFELGIGSVTPGSPFGMGVHTSNGYRPGASLRGWREYFSNAVFAGADIDQHALFTDDRIQTYQVDAFSQDSIRQMWLNVRLSCADFFDLIVDDGYHDFPPNARFFVESFDRLKPGGLYIIEDIRVAEDHLKQYQNLFEMAGVDACIVELPKTPDPGDNCLALIRRRA